MRAEALLYQYFMLPSARVIFRAFKPSRNLAVTYL
ncbi:hypothetical protein Pvag_0531 [Pantoea vagans C9-1]|nr:hypothetical protein Pvag_0531 [Pantoea vagans C9-1]